MSAPEIPREADISESLSPKHLPLDGRDFTNRARLLFGDPRTVAEVAIRFFQGNSSLPEEELPEIESAIPVAELPTETQRLYLLAHRTTLNPEIGIEEAEHHINQIPADAVRTLCEIYFDHPE